MYEILVTGAILGGRLAGSALDPINWVLMAAVFAVAASMSRPRIAAVGLTASFIAIHIGGMWSTWKLAGVLDTMTVSVVLQTKVIFACVAYGLGRAARRVFGHP